MSDRLEETRKPGGWMTPEEAFTLLGKALHCTEHSMCESDRRIIIERFFNYPLLEAAAKMVVKSFDSEDSDELFLAVIEIERVMNNPFTGYRS